MRKLLILSTFSLLWLVACTAPQQSKSTHLYIITTNDIHSNINAMAQLATIVDEYEAKGEVLLVDAGDRITGNAFVDDAPQPGVPMVELMNYIGYDVVTFGNHEFDYGYNALCTMLDKAEFCVVCSNVYPYEDMPNYMPEALFLKEVDGVKIGFAGVVSTDSDGRPSGSDEALAPYYFTPDIEIAEQMSGAVNAEFDYAILLSHMGLKMDRNLAERTSNYDWIVGGHSHDFVCERVGDVQITQNGSNLYAVTIADIEIQDGEILNITFSQEVIDDEPAKKEVIDMVADIKRLSPELNVVEGSVSKLVTKDGVANFTVDALERYPYADGFVPEISIYHYGGIRLTNILPGDISRGDIYNNDPFKSKIVVGEMTTEQLRTMILDKYNNGTVKDYDKESHYNYFRMNIPYTILVGDTPAEMPDAIDVILPTLEAGRTYRVAMANYIAQKYIDKAIVHSQLRSTDILVRTAMLEHLHTFTDGYTPDNKVYQIEVPASQYKR